MADIIKVDVETMRNTASKFTSCQQELQTAYLTMSNAVRALDGSYDGRMAMARITHGDARHEIEILASGVVPEMDARPAHQGHPWGVGGHNVLLVKSWGIRGCH